MTVFDRVKNLCDLMGISISQLEEKIEISSGAAYKWKTSSPSQKMFQKLSAFFDVSIDYLMTGKESEANDIPPLMPEQFELLELYSRLKKEQKDAVLNLLRSFAL